MKVLLDTHAFIWWMTDDARLSPRARAFFAHDDHTLILSVASAWEIALKIARRRLHLPVTMEGVQSAVRDQRVERLAIEFEHAVAAATLPGIHGDPFDRMLVAQAMALGCPIVTQDPKIARYPVETIW
jgi:PIN domain nuclease of toxin-antitoxin system